MTRAWILMAAAAVALSACQEGPNGRRDRAVASGGGGLCKPFTTANANAAPAMGGDGGSVVDDCLHRWGYTLAKSEDDADVVAQAVVAACSAPLARWNQQTLGMAAANGGSLNAPSLLTGEDSNPIAEHRNFAEGRALFYVVQARAGKCDPPRVRDEDDRAQAPVQQAPAYTPNSPDR